MNKEIQNFIYWYMKELYLHYYDGQHPFVRSSQFKRCHDVLINFVAEREINLDDLKDMAIAFFENVNNSDNNINHFCTEGILKRRYAEVFGNWSQV